MHTRKCGRTNVFWKLQNPQALNQYAFTLQTGLRAGELIGLRWSDIDLDNKIIHVKRTMRYDSRSKTWLTGGPKTANSILEVPLNPRSSLYINEAERTK